MNYDLYHGWAVTFANKYADSMGTTVDHLFDEFNDVMSACQPVFEKLSTSQPMRIEVLQSFPDISGDDLTLAAKQNFDPCTCPIVDSVIVSMVDEMVKRRFGPHAVVKAALEDVIYNDWQPMIDITKALIADEAVLKLLKSELMVHE
jgi:hypothetical protein